MTQTWNNYGRVLYELAIPKECIEETAQIYQKVEELKKIFADPTVKIEKKHRLVERLFPKEMEHFLKVLCDHHLMGDFEEIYQAYEIYKKKQEHILSAVLTCTDPPNEEQLLGIKKFLKDTYGKKEVNLTLREDKSLIGGFILTADGHEYDWSLLGRWKQLKKMKLEGNR